MKGLVLNELYLYIKKKNLYLLGVIQIIILISIYMVYSSSNAELLRTNYIDGVLRVCGGIEKEFFLIYFCQWFIILGILIAISQNNAEIKDDFDLMILIRAESRIKWWTSKLLSLAIVVFIYVLLLLLEGYILSIIIFKNTPSFSKYSSIYYPNISEFQGSFYTLQAIVITIITTGFLAISTLFQTISVAFNNNKRCYTTLIVVTIILGMLYNKGLIPRQLSPMHYASSIDINPNIKSYISYISFNLVVFLGSSFIGGILVGKKDIDIIFKS
ncbi:hypothetical protein ACOAKC_10245 [Hathewaya histolytica]|uniref:hypothetical protein n=1 Tax=Hathewaya histolytica TaxID=1498 RepID=UPI003B67E987